MSRFGYSNQDTYISGRITNFTMIIILIQPFADSCSYFDVRPKYTYSLLIISIQEKSSLQKKSHKS